MGVRWILIGWLLGMSVSAPAMDRGPCGSILDVDHLTVEEKGKIRAELQQFHAQRKVDGKAVCVQIDLLEQLPPVQKGFTEDGRKIIHQTVYDQWQSAHFGQPAVLFLFVKDPQQGTFALHDMVISRPMTQRIPDLVRRYIRDVIVKKQATNYEAISAGIHALSQALNDEYKERIVEESNKLLTENYYYRGYTYYPLYYFYFTANHVSDKNIGCDYTSYFIDGKMHDLFLLEQKEKEVSLSTSRATYLDLYLDRKVGYLSDVHGNKTNVEGTGSVILSITKKHASAIHTQDDNQVTQLINPIDYKYEYLDFSGSLDFASTKDLEKKGEGKYIGLSNKISKISKNDFHFKEWKFVKYKSPLVFDNHQKHCLCSVKITTGIKSKGEAYTTQEGLSTYGKTRFKGSQCTMCNHYASNLSTIVGTRRGVPADKPTSDLETEFKKGGDYINLKNFAGAGKELFWKYINLGYPVYFCKSGHIETGYPSGYENIGHKERFEEEFKKSNLSTYDASTTFHTIGAGAQTGMKHYDGFSFLSNPQTGAFLYLGYLKK